MPIISISGDGIDDLLVSTGGWEVSVPYSEPKGTIEYFDENGVLIDKGSGEYNRHEMILGPMIKGGLTT